MNVGTRGAKEVPVWINQRGTIATGKEVPRELMPSIEARRVGAEKPFHPGHEVGLRCFNDEMKMIRHETIGAYLPGGFGAAVSECLEKGFSIVVVSKNLFPAIAATGDVINSP
jgi:hypothetical protein